MKIAVCLKAVAEDDWKPRIVHGLPSCPTEYQMNPSDEYAVEEALLLKEWMNKPETEVILISKGIQKIRPVLVTGLGMGADRAIHIVDSNPYEVDTQRTAIVLSRLLQTIQPDLVIMGNRSSDFPHSQIPTIVAQRLNYILVDRIQRIEYDSSELIIWHQIASNDVEKAIVSLPVVLSVGKGINEPRSPSFRGIMAAEKKEIQTIPVDDLVDENDFVSKVILESFQILPSRVCRQMEGTMEKLAKDILKILQERGQGE